GPRPRPAGGGRLADSGPLPPGCVIALFEAQFADGGSELYQLPHRMADDGEIVLGLADPPLARALLAALRRSATGRRKAARVELEPAATLPAEDALEPVRAIGGEQSNSSV